MFIELLLRRKENYMREKPLEWANYIRAVATIMVVVLHVCAPTLEGNKNLSNGIWHWANGIESVTRVSVPLFLLLTGALLIDKKESITSIFKHRLTKIVFPFLFWSVFYNTYYSINSDAIKSFEDIWVQRKLIFNGLFTGSTYHFWYIYLIIGIYLFLPILRTWLQNASKNQIKYFILIWTYTLFLKYPVINSNFPNLDLTLFTGYIGYLVTGYYLVKYPISYSKYTRLICIGLFSIGYLITSLGTFYASVNQGTFNNIFYDYLAPNVVLMTVSCFVFFQTFSFVKNRLNPVFDQIAKYSFGIYLIHVFFIYVLDDAQFQLFETSTIVDLFLKFIITFSISFICIKFIDKLPFKKYLIG